MWKIFIKDIFNILLLSHIQTTWNQLSTDVRRSPFLSRKELRFVIFPQLSLAFLRFRKAEEVQHVTVIPIDSHTAFYFPPGRLLWPSADNQIVQTVRLQKENISMFSLIHTQRNQLSTASFWLAVHLTADRPTMHRKFWRISSFKELWAMKRILSLHSRKELRFANFPQLSFAFLFFIRKHSSSPLAIL